MFAKKSISYLTSAMLAGVLMFAWFVPTQAALPADTLNPNPPAQTVKLVFIHHSTGENWLRDDYGLLGKTLNQNNYFVSDTNYGWGPNSIGDRTDIPDWTEWFRSADTPTYMNALFAENSKHSTYTRTQTNPGGQNTIVMFKSCFPNSNLEGSPNDPPDPTYGYTVGHAKYVYNEILKYFRAHPDKLFVVVTAPPVTDSTYANNARAFNNWLFNDWLTVNNYPFNNVAVFDFYNVLTSPNAHHRYDPVTGSIEHVVTSSNISYYPSGDDHPNSAGSKKATNEFVPLLNIFYNRWVAANNPQTSAFYSDGSKDGWVIESGENSNKGGKADSSSTIFRIGDDAGNKQYRAVLSFDTSSLPDDAIISRATLMLKRQGTTGKGNPISLLQGFMVDMKKGLFNTSALQPADFQTAISKTYSIASPTLSSGWYSLNLTNGSAYINKTATNDGLTQIRLRFKMDDNNNSVANYLKLYSGNADAASQPILTIQYYLP